MLKKNNPIAVFDSGVGGISVLRELVKILPNEDYIYYGDSKHAPYGMKDKETVKKLTIDAAEYLFAQGAKGLVVACNTATSAAVRALREMYPDIPIVGINQIAEHICVSVIGKTHLTNLAALLFFSDPILKPKFF